MRRLLAVPLLALALAITSPGLAAAADIIVGRVIKVADGDTITVLTAARDQVRVRLASIDAPERGQPWGTRSREALAELVAGQEVTIEHTDTDRYGRVIGRVLLDTVDINADQVASGWAWVYRQYSDDPELRRLEAAARDEGLGLWADQDPVPPWEWRRR